MRTLPQMNDDIAGFEIRMSDAEIKTLYYAVSEAIRLWPGSPARPAEEQEQLRYIKEQLFRMILHMSFEQS